MANRDGHITLETRFGGGLRLDKSKSDYGKVRDPEAGERRHKIEDFEEERRMGKESSEVWD